MIDSQRLAAQTVRNVLSGRNLTQALSELWRANPQLSAQQKGSIQDLSYGVLRFYGQLQRLLDSLLNKPVKDDRLAKLMLVALYQLEYSQASSHAVVNHAVEAAKKLNPHATGLVNAVLRNFLRQQQSLLAAADSAEVGRYNHPQWWIDKLKQQYPRQFESILQAGNERPPMTLRINRRKTTTEAYLLLLTEQGIGFKQLAEYAVKLDQPIPVEKLPGFQDGLISVQDLGAQWAAQLLDIGPGMRVLDACSAPGGKTAHMLETADIELTSLDISGQRLGQIEQNLQRLGLRATTLLGDASQIEAWWDGKPFARILADVPCSASGVVRRHPDIKWLRRPGDFANFAAQQKQILDALWRTLERDGKLLYATCSVFVEENDELIADFLLRHQDATRHPLPGEIRDGQLLPDDQHDGFFYALLQKG